MREDLKRTATNGKLNKIKVCHIIITLSFGGAERMLVRLLLADPESTSQNMVLVLRRAGAWGEQLQAAGVIVHELGMDSIWDFPRVFYQLKKLIRFSHPDIVQTWMYHADLLGGLAARFSGNKNIVWGIRMTSVSTSNRLTVLIMKVCSWLSYWLPKKIICVAESAKQGHIKDGYDATRMTVIPNGFDFARFTATAEQKIALREFCHFSENDIIIGSVGRFHPDKGQDNFIKAAAIVSRNYQTVKFLLVGRDCDANNAQLMAWLNDCDLTDRFTLLGQRDDIPVCLAAMDIFCMPSRTEGFPNGLGEAMSMGLPCVATDVGDTSTLVGDTAILVPPQNEQALAQGLLKVIALSAKQRKQMGQRAKARVMGEFSIEKARARFEAVYQEVMLESKT